MAAFKGLVDGQCGNTNPLIQLSQHLAQDKTHVLQDGLIHPSTTNSIDTGANQFVQEYHQPLAAPTTFRLDNLLSNLQLTPNPSDDAQERQWTREFLMTTSSSMNQPFVVQQQQVALPTVQQFPHYSTVYHPSVTNFLFPTQLNHLTTQEERNLRAYLEERESLMTTVDVDSKLIDSNTTNENNSTPTSISWNKVENTNDSRKLYSEYKFVSNNPYLDHSNLYEEGVRHLAAHDIVNALLYFEATGWLYLGMTQSENEQDQQAIYALNKCLELDPNNLQAYMTLATCYANESLVNDAMETLRQWLSHSPEYAHLLSSPTKMIESEFPDVSVFEELQRTFLLAISASSNRIDSDLQTCFGILFHLSYDYDKAVECFHTAVLTKPDDARLWNKLGASLANAGESEKAVDAYYHALTLAPGFVRARYNLGISCFNLHAYTQAVEHFLTALKQQNEGIGPLGAHAQMSDNIWRTLKISLTHLERFDLETAVFNRDLSKLLKEFRID